MKHMARQLAGLMTNIKRLTRRKSETEKFKLYFELLESDKV